MAGINRRKFITMTAKILAATATFGLIPDSAEAARRKLDDVVTIPALTEIKSLKDMNISDVPLIFKEELMDIREYTGAIVLHHAGMARGDFEMPTQTIHDLHIGNGWAGAGYHFVIHKDGTIDRARPLKFAGAHAAGNNTFTVGICMTGNYNDVVPPVEQIFSAQQLVAALCEHYKIRPSTSTIFGHRQLCSTSCPGDKFFPYLPNVIRNVQSVI